MGQQRHVGKMDTESVVAAIAEEVKMTKTVNKMNASSVVHRSEKPCCPSKICFLWMHRFFAGGLGTEERADLDFSVSAVLEVVCAEDED